MDPATDKAIKEIQRSQPGAWTLTTPDSEFWFEQQNTKALKLILAKTAEKIASHSEFVNSLRRVIVAPDITAEAARYQEILGPQITAASSYPDGAPAGKALLWGSHKNVEDTFGVILLREDLAIDILTSEKGLNVFAHEVAHLESGFLVHQTFGSAQPLGHNDWYGIRKRIGKTVFADCFAEVVALPYYDKKETVEATLRLSIDCLKTTAERIAKRTAIYRRYPHQDILKYWNGTVEDMASLFNQLGRGIGILLSLNDTAQWDSFHSAVEDASPHWIPVVDDLRLALDAFFIEAWAESTFDAVYEAIEKGFVTIGIPIDKLAGK